MESSLDLTTPSRESSTEDSAKRDSSRTINSNTAGSSRRTLSVDKGSSCSRTAPGIKGDSQEGKLMEKESLFYPTGKYLREPWSMANVTRENSSGPKEDPSGIPRALL